MNTTRCSVCGSECEIVSSDEGTSYYRPLAEEACAEMRASLEDVVCLDPDDCECEWCARTRHALSSDAGKGWLSPQEADALRQERDAWIEDSRQANRNTEYYRGLVVMIGESFGVVAKTSDDGSIQEDVLCAKVPELVKQQGQELARLRDALEAVMEWVVQFATPMADELKQTVRELLKEKA